MNNLPRGFKPACSSILISTLLWWRCTGFILPPGVHVLPIPLGETSRPGLLAATDPIDSHQPLLVEGILSYDEFNRHVQVDATIQALQEQLPTTLLKPLTAISAKSIYQPKVRLTVLVDSDEIDLLQSREELISLSDVLVLATTAAQQANSVFSGGARGGKTPPPPLIECQLAMDDSCQSILIPWKAKVPVLLANPAFPNTGVNQFEGLSEFVMDSSLGTVQQHRIRNVTWNGQAVNGPAIGQALRAVQSTVTNLQQNPIFQGLTARSSGGNGNGAWADLRDGLLEQAASAASSRSSTPTQNSTAKPILYTVESTKSIKGWIESSTGNIPNVTVGNMIPLPGTPEWKDYAIAHASLIQFCDDIIPTLSGISNTRSGDTAYDSYFAKNATLVSMDGSTLLKGKDQVANFYQGLALTRRGTGGKWQMRRCNVLEWSNRTISIDYVATNNPWTIRGRDIYTLQKPNADYPIIENIQQLELSATTPDGSVSLDSRWLMKNLATAVERSSTPTMIGPNVRDLLQDILLQQQLGLPATAISKKPSTKMSSVAAANAYYIMADLHEQVPDLCNGTSIERVLPPAAQYMAENVELRGYLGETLVRGSNLYNRAIGSLIATTRQSVAQKRLILEQSPTPRVELTPKGNIRLSMILVFRLPPPSMGTFLPENAMGGGVPFKLELVSDYVLDRKTGLVNRHRLIETRVNGQLTPGDFLSRSLQRLLNIEQDATARTNGDKNDDLLRTFSDAVTWIRSFSNPG